MLLSEAVIPGAAIAILLPGGNRLSKGTKARDEKSETRSDHIEGPDDESQ